MANALYDAGREGFLAGEIDWGSEDIRTSLVRDYTFSAAHDYLDDVVSAGGEIVASSEAMADATTTSGVADATDVVFAAVQSGDPITSVIIHTEGSSSNETRRLIAYIDTGTGLSVTPNGADITIVWDSGANKIFRL